MRHKSRAFVAVILVTSLIIQPVHALDVTRNSQQTLEPRLHLPFVARSPKFEIIPLYDTPVPACDYSNCLLHGYVLNLTNTPIYSMVLSVHVTWYPYVPLIQVPLTLTSSTELLTASTRFTATLPGQINPFRFYMAPSKRGYTVSDIQISSRSLTSGATYWPLTVTQLVRIGNLFQGIVRNDTGRLIRGAQVVVFDRTSSWGCTWLDATLTDSTLAPGATTAFSATQNMCVLINPIPLAQGAE